MSDGEAVGAESVIPHQEQRATVLQLPRPLASGLAACT